MYSDEDLNSAAAAGILPADTVEALRAHMSQKNQTSAVDEESFRLVTGFNDIFVVIACGLVLTALHWIGNAVGAGVGPAAAAATAWLLAEFFVRKRRMALPAIVLLIAFLGEIFAFGYRFSHVLPGALCLFGAGLHWWRFRVPITVAAGLLAVLYCLGSLVRMIPGANTYPDLITLGGGAIAFCVALRWDASDPKRKTRRSDAAFWLHLLAAPFLVQPIFSFLHLFTGVVTNTQMLIVALLYAALAIISLVIDRRALMVSALGYVFYTFSMFFAKQFGAFSLNAAMTAAIIGTLMLILSAYWRRSRAFVLRFVPLTWRSKLAPLS